MNWFRRLALVCFSYVMCSNATCRHWRPALTECKPPPRAVQPNCRLSQGFLTGTCGCISLYLTAQLRMTAQTAASVSICSLLAMYLVRRRLASELADAMRVCLLCTFWLVAWLPALRQRNTDPGLVQLRHLHRCHQKPARKHREAIKTCRKTPTGPDSQHVLGRMGKPCSF